MSRRLNSLRKILITLACICFSLSLTFSVGCTNTTDGDIVFVGYEDITVRVGFGSNASLLQYVTAVDQNGKAYRCSVSVKDSKGNPVEVLFDRFNVESMDGYTAETTIIGHGLKRNINIIVEDRSAIFIEEFSNKLIAGFVGEEYDLPNVQASKVSGEEIVAEYKVYYQNGNALEEVKVENQKFTPTERGVYTLEISATDSIGQNASKTAKFNVRNPMPYNMFEDFSDELSKSSIIESQAWGAKDKIQYGDGFYTTWHQSFEGRNGVVESLFNTTLTNKRVCTTFSYGKDYLAQVIDGMTAEDYLSIWIWIDKEGNFPAYRNEEEGEWAELGTVKGREWQEIRIYKNNLTRFAELQSIDGNVGLNRDELFFVWNIADGEVVKYYLDSVSLIKASFEGSTTPTLNQKFTLPKLSFVGINGKNIEVESEISCKLLNSDITFDVLNGETTFTTPGKYEVIYSTKLDGVDYEYTSYLTIESGNTDSLLDIDGFGSNLSTERFIKSSMTYSPNGFYVKWLPEFEGQNGVIETVLNDSASAYRRINYKFDKTEEQLNQMINGLSDDGYIAVRIWLDLEGKYTIRNLGEWGIVQQKIVGQTWETIKISKQALLNQKFATKIVDGNPKLVSFAEAYNSSASGEIGFLALNNGDGGSITDKKDAIRIYFDSIYLVDIEVNGADIEPEGGAEYTLPTCKFVKDANGNAINLACDVKITKGDVDYTYLISNGKVTFVQNGEYKITYSYDGVVCFEKVVRVVDKNIVEDFSEPTSINNIVASKDNNSYSNTPFYTRWHEEFNGKNGVLETITNNNSYEKRVCGISDRLLAMSTLMDDDDYVSMVVFVDGTGKFQFTLNKSWGDNFGMAHVECGKWHEIKISKAMLEASTSKGERIFTIFNPSDKDIQYVVYIDDIRLVKV